MLVLIEGPDGCGKTTLFNALRGSVDATFVPNLPMRCPHVPEMERRTEHLWWHLYRDDALYICDRGPVVSSLVYSKSQGRTCMDYSRWRSRILVLYLDVSVEELSRRLALRDEASPSEQLRCLYNDVLSNFCCVKLDGSLPVEELVRRACKHMWIHWSRELRRLGDGRGADQATDVVGA